MAGFLNKQHDGFPRSGTALPFSVVGTGWTPVHGSGALQDVTPARVGHIFVTGATLIGSAALTVTGLSGGGVTTWTLSTQQVSGTTTAAIAWGFITSTGLQTITWAFTGGTLAGFAALTQEFTAPAATVAGPTGQLITGTGNPRTFPSLTPTLRQSLYAGYGQGGATWSPPTTPGYAYLGAAAGADMLIWNNNCPASVAQVPQANNTAGSTLCIVAAVLTP